MSETFLFAWGVLAFALAVGPLAVAGLLDLRAQSHKKEMDRAAGLDYDGLG